ncbi:MAG: hypothetical protein LC745_09520 [Planctomycetia bacterium]|nr:hypothetical protein [Planctomycetia bacterium]
MSTRVGFWLAGVVVGVVLGAAVPETLFPGARPILFGAGFLLLGLLGEGVSSLLRGQDPGAVTARDRRPADGNVDLAGVPGVRREANPVDPRFGAYLGPDAAHPTDDVAGPAQRMSPPLLGRVAVVSLFVGRDGRDWSAREIAEAHQALTRAGQWLEAEAIRHGAAVNLELGDTYFSFHEDAEDEVAVGFAAEGDDVGPWEEGATTKALVTASRAAARLGFRDAEDLFRTVAALIRADATVWLMHPRQAGRSFAVPLEDSALRGVSLAVCYPRESSFPEPLAGAARPDPVTLVHELLHLFGATDKYGQSLREFPARSVSSREVMRLQETRLSRLRIDPGTAQEIGWRRR